MLKHLWGIWLAVCISANAHAAPVLLVNAGQLMGATGVAVNGLNYSVQFQDGTCVALFGGCDASANFTFASRHDAVTASQALLQSVFVDTAEGLFGSNPALTHGCTDAHLCQVFTPFPPTPEGFLSLAIALNYSAAAQTPDATQVLITNRPFGDTVGIAGYTYAVWSQAPASEVPEPSTLWLVGGALALWSWVTNQGYPRRLVLGGGASRRSA